MIAGIKGELINKRNFDRYSELEVYTLSGISYAVLAPLSESIVDSGEVTLFTAHVIREDSQTLYGFFSRVEKELFERLITVSGVGPKTAISILSYYGYDETISLISDGDEKSLSKVSGLGIKSAKKIIIELQTKIDELGTLETTKQPKETTNIRKQNIKELEEALSSLGFTGIELKKMAENAKEILKESPQITIENLITEVLKK
jgi:Holliday junction DNA helicase RuvA